MKRILKACCVFPLILSLAACGGQDNRQPSNTVSAINSEPTGQVPADSSEQAPPSSFISSESTQAASGIEAVGASPASAGSVEAESTSVPQPPPASRENPDPQDPVNAMRFEENGTMKINLQMGDHMFTATLEENPAADSFAGLLKNAPLSMQMRDYAGFEKVGSLGTTLPASDSQTTTQSGDIVLYNGNQIVIFYGSNSWSYTRLGRIDDLTGWEAALGNGDLTVTFSVG